MALLIWVVWCRPSELFGLRPQGFCSRSGIRVAGLMKGAMIKTGLGSAAGSGMVDCWIGMSLFVARVMSFQFFRVQGRREQGHNFHG